MAQIRYQSYGTEIRSKGAIEPVAIAAGIGPLFGYNIISYDGANVILSGDPNRNIRRNLTTERGFLVNPRSAVITPDGIMALETSEVVIPINLGDLSIGRELVVIAKHTWTKDEGGTPTSYRVVVNPSSDRGWLASLSDAGASIDTWLKLVPDINRVNEVIIAYCRISNTDSAIVVSDILNPYNYTWQSSPFVRQNQHQADINNLKSLIPALGTRNINLTDLVSVLLVDGNNQPSHSVTLDNPPLHVYGKVGLINISGKLRFNSGINTRYPLKLSITATTGYQLKELLNTKFRVPVAISYLESDTADPDTGGRLNDNNYALYGEITYVNNTLSLVMDLYPVYQNTDRVISSVLYPVIDFFIPINFMTTTTNNLSVTLNTKAQEGTTGSGQVTGGGRYDVGTMVSLSADPTEGSSFVGWYEGPLLISTSPDYTFKIERSVNYTAVFNGAAARASLTVTVNPSGAAQVQSNPYYDIMSEAVVSLINITSGYTFSHWVLNGVNVTGNPLRFTIQQDSIVTAILQALTYSLTVRADRGGVINVLPSKTTYNAGEKVTVSISTPSIDAGWLFKGWEGPNGYLSYNTTFEYTIPAANSIINVRYIEAETPKKTLSLSIVTPQTGDKYAGTVAGAGLFPQGSTVPIQATPQTWVSDNQDFHNYLAPLKLFPSSPTYFLGWVLPNGQVVSTNPYNVVLSGDMSIAARMNAPHRRPVSERESSIRIPVIEDVGPVVIHMYGPAGVQGSKGMDLLWEGPSTLRLIVPTVYYNGPAKTILWANAFNFINLYYEVWDKDIQRDGIRLYRKKVYSSMVRPEMGDRNTSLYNGQMLTQSANLTFPAYTNGNTGYYHYLFFKLSLRDDED